MMVSLKSYPVGILMMVMMAVSGCEDRKAPPGVGPAKSDSFDELIIKHNCLACHLEGNSMELPAWPQVAEKYSHDKTANEHLAHKIRQGGSGVWGKMDMPPYPEIDASELKIIVDGILSVDYPAPVAKTKSHGQ